MLVIFIPALMRRHIVTLFKVRIAITRIVQWGGELTRSNRVGSKNGQVSLRSNILLSKSFSELAYVTIYHIKRLKIFQRAWTPV